MQEQHDLPEATHVKQEEHVIADYVDGMKELELEAYQTSIRKARNTLFVAAALVFIGEMISIGQIPGGITAVTMAIVLVETGLFVALGFWSKKKPFAAIVAGIVLIIIYWLLAIWSNPENIFRGILARIVMIVYLARATSDARNWEALKKERDQG